MAADIFCRYEWANNMQAKPVHVELQKRALRRFLDKTSELIVSRENKPEEHSIAACEAAESSISVEVANIWTLCTIQNEHGGDHLSLFLKSLEPPIESISALTCVRSMLEVCSISTWMSEPTITSRERISRSFAHRYEGLANQLTLTRTSNRPQQEVDGCMQAIHKLEQRAQLLGFTALVSKKGKPIAGVCQEMPSATAIIETSLGLGSFYRILSGLAHGHFYALFPLVYEQTATEHRLAGVPMLQMEKVAKPDALLMAGTWAFRAMSKSLWNYWRYMGWNDLHLEEVLEDCADGMSLRIERRFWRSPVN